MNPFFKRFKKLWVIVLNVLLIGFSSYFIWHSEKFQEKISPKKYWESKIKILESELKKDVVRIKSLQLDLEKENALCPYHKKQAKIKAEEINENVNDIFFKIENEHIKKMNEIKHEIDELLIDKAQITEDLNIAYNQIKILN